MTAGVTTNEPPTTTGDPIATWGAALGFGRMTAVARDGTRLNVVTGGTTSGRPVVLLHGAPQFSYEWRQVMTRLADRYRLFAPDLRGYGASDLAASDAYDIDTLTGDLEGIVDDIGAERVLLVAHDWGGPIAWRFAELHPDRVRHLVAANAPHPGAFAREIARVRQAVRSWYIALFQLPGLERWIERTDGALFARMLSSSRGVFTPEDLRIYRAAFARPGRARAILAYYRTAFGPGLRERRRAMLAAPRIRCPTTVVWGDADAALAPSHPDAIRPFVEHLEVRHLPGVGHWVPEQRPDEVVRALIEGDAAG